MGCIRNMKKLLLANLLLLFVFSVSGYGQVVRAEQALSGLKAGVTVRRDARSIPYIEAKNLQDLYFVQGYETARDRLWQMDLLRRVARGRVSELFGKAALAEDRRWRNFGFSVRAEESLKKLNPELKSALENYANGVNAYIGTLDKQTMPAEFQILQVMPEKWFPTDTIVIGKILADGLSTTWWQDLNRLGLQALSKEKFESMTNPVTPSDVVLFGKDTKRPDVEMKGYARLSLDKELSQIITEEQNAREQSLKRAGFFAENLAASNNWVISGKRTFDGKAILANDPHLQPTAPGIWYLTHLTAPGMRVSGVTFPGVPGVILGHNGRIAWGATNVGPDVQDVYIEEFNDKGEYKTPAGWVKPTIRKEIIKFRKNALSPDLDEESVDVLETRNGVVFREIDGKKASLQWTAFDPLNQEFEAFMILNKASNWKDFRAALSNYGGATQNFVYADVEGNIGWQVAGKIPIRRKGDGSLPYDGTKNDGDWVGYIKQDELPVLFNPPSGFIVTANQRIAGTDYKYSQLTRQIAGPWRARRIFDLLQSNSKITMDDVNDIQHDVFNIPLSMFSNEVVKRKAASAQVLDVLKGWDGKMNADSNAAVLANAINTCVGNEIADANPPANGWQIRQFVLPFAIPANEELWLPAAYKNWNEFLNSCSTKTWKTLTEDKNLGPDSSKWRWGSVSKASFMHPLAAVPLIGGRFKVEYDNVGGNGQTPNVGDSVSMRHIAKPANWDETRHVIPLGQSGNASSPHWTDQFESWRTGKVLLFPFGEKAVSDAAKESVYYMPRVK